MRRSLLTITPLPRPCARWLAGRGEGFNYIALYLYLSLALALVAEVQQFNRCQIARSILYCSIIIVGPSEEAKSQVSTILVLGTGWRSVCTLIIFLKCAKAIFYTFGYVRGFSHVIMEVDCMEHSPQFSLNSVSYPVTNRSAR